ncbi:MAG: ATP-dependent DNA ligase [Nibricoccus sp.]
MIFTRGKPRLSRAAFLHPRVLVELCVMSWDVQFCEGVWLPQIGWWLDATLPVERSFVSHAHFDHLAPHQEVVCSEGTARLMRARMPDRRTEHILPFGHTEQLTHDTTVTLYPAGHIYGSSLCLLDHAEHGTLLYTGDFKLRKGLSAEPCATPQADVVIMETTFGRLHYVFPPTQQVLDDIARFCRHCIEDGTTPVLFGYSLGKSQELLSGLAEAQLPVMLHPQTHRLTKIYEELGIRFPPYRAFASNELAGHVVICPPQANNSTFLRAIPNRCTAMITGWAIDAGAKYRYQCDHAFPLSDHADFPDLNRFVDLVQPKRVYTLHGFASDFARHLRDRGIEAWAIGTDNQLELAIETAPTVVTFSAESTSQEKAEPESLEQFARTAERTKTTSGKLEKIEILSHYFATLSDDCAALGALFFTGRAFPQSENRILNLGWSAIRRAVLEASGLTVADFRQAYLRFSDSGDTAEALLIGRTQPEPFSLENTARLFDHLAAARGPQQKLSLLQERLARLSAPAAKYLIKIMTGDLRIGLKEGLVEEAIAASTGRALDAVREANMLCGDISRVMRAARSNQLNEITLQLFNPVQFMLASPAATAAEIIERLGAPVWLEEKYDGIRCQLHKLGSRAELYSRDLNRITEQFPDLARAAIALPEDFVLDGELLAWRNGRALPFAELQKRLGRKGGDDFFLGAEIPVSVSAYDLLWHGGRSLLKEPLAARREILARLFGAETGSFVLAPTRQANSDAEIEAAFLAARERGNEGLMAKDPCSAYTPGRRCLSWLKLKKAYATLDVVVVGVEYGHGKRRGVLSDYTYAVRDTASEQLLTVGKAYSGLTDAEIAHYTQHFLENTTEVHGHYRAVVPDVVIEVAFDSIQPSDRHESGFALRFPRIVRIRSDKTVAEIDTLETCRVLAAGSTGFANSAT